MVAHEPLTMNGDTPELPKKVRINGNTPTFAPNELRVLKAMTGRTLESIMADECDAIQAMIWTECRRLGFTAVTWEQCGDIEGEMVAPEPDPTTGSDSMTSLPSAAFGAADLAISTDSTPTSSPPSSGT